MPENTHVLVGFAVFAILLIIVPLVYGYTRNAMTPAMSSLASTNFNNTVAQVDSNAWTGFQLAAVGIIIAAAALIIGYVVRGFGTGG